jgi:hypothetical protein
MLGWLAVIILLGGPASAGATTVTGTITVASGRPLVSGRITFQLSQEGIVTTPGLTITQPVIACLIVTGSIANCTLTSNAEISPAGTYYQVRIYSSAGVQLLPPRNYAITGSSWNIGEHVPLASTVITASAYQILADESINLPQQRRLNFIGAAVNCVNNSTLNQTDCTFSPGVATITSLNGLTGATQTFAAPGTTGTAPNWVSSGTTHTLHLPLAATASVTAGLISKTQYDAFDGKAATGTCTNQFIRGLSSSSATCATVSMTADITGITPSANGGTNSAYFGVSGPTQARTYAFPDTNATIEYQANKNAASGYAGLDASTKLAAAQLPAAAASALGGVNSADCSATGHVQKINTDGSITCSADDGGISTINLGTAGTAPAWTSATQTLDLPMASATGVTAGMVTKTEHDAFTAKVGGSGTAGCIPKLTGSSTLGDSVVCEDGTTASVGTTAAGKNLTVNATLGAEGAPALTTGNWTFNAGYWQYLTVPDQIEKFADGTGTLTPTAATTIVAGTTYKVTITVDSISGSTATYTLGGVTGKALISATTYTDYLTAATTGKLIITPTATGLRAVISAISILPLTDATGDLIVNGNLTVNSPVLSSNGSKAFTISPSGVLVLPNSVSLGGENTTGGVVPLIGLDSGGNRALAGGAFYISGAGFYPGTAGSRSIGLTTLPVSNLYTLESTITSGVANSGGGHRRLTSEAVSAALSGATSVIAVNIPVGARILGAQLRVDTLIASGDGGTTWSAAYSGGAAAQAITTGQAFAKNTKANQMFDPNVNSPLVTSSVGTITITCDGAGPTFSAGVIRAIVYYEDFTAMGNNP